MAHMMCNLEDITNAGERQFYQLLDEYLHDACIVYWNRELYGKEFDFMAILPGEAIIVFEVKGWAEKTVVGVTAQDFIQISVDGSVSLENPRKQARGYRFAIENHIRKKLAMKPRVIHMVVFPFVKSEVFYAKQMNLVSPPEITLLNEDLSISSAFHKKIGAVVGQNGYYKNFDLLTPDSVSKIRGLFEPRGFVDDAGPTTYSEHPVSTVRRPYSILSHISYASSGWQQQVDELVEAYAHGVRVYSTVDSRGILARAEERLQSLFRLRNLQIGPSTGDIVLGEGNCIPRIEDGRLTAFNWGMSLLPDHVGPFESALIVDGRGIDVDDVGEWLSVADECNAINLDQIRVEHAKTRRNIMVKAGAGTGKTYAMVLRVAYIVYAESLVPSELKNRVVMITFTTDAAEIMKKRIKRWFENYFLLTGQKRYLDFVAQVEHMHISTIHSYAKNLIEKLGAIEGLGKTIHVTSGNYERGKIVDVVLEEKLAPYLKNNPQFLSEELGARTWEIRNLLLELIQKLEGKNVDIASVSPNDFGTMRKNPALHDLIRTIVPEVEKIFHEDLLKDNRVFLSRLIPLLERIVGKHEERTIQEIVGSKYMFIDEFQDTDNVQIEVLWNIARLSGSHVFVVGDIKQCIYRFRGAEEHAFDYLHEISRSGAQWLEPFTLRKNYRSDIGLLRKFHGLFQDWAGKELLAYHDDDKLVGTKNLLGTGSGFHQIRVPSGKKPLDYLFKAIDRCKTEITAHHSERYQNDIAACNSQPLSNSEEKTIAILVRENWQAKSVVKAAEARGIYIESPTGGTLYQTSPAIDLSILLQAMTIQANEQLSRLLSSNWFKVPFDRSNVYKIKQHSRFREHQSSFLLEQVNEELKITAKKTGYESWDSVLENVRRQPVMQVLRRLYQQLEPWTRYSSNPKARLFYRANANWLTEKIIANFGGDGLGLWQLSSWVRRNIVTKQEEDAREPAAGKNGVRIVCRTVHKAKGLEYEVVILPYSSPFERPNQKGVDVFLQLPKIGYRVRLKNTSLQNEVFNVQREEGERKKEEVRILYVALTRAIKHFVWIDETSSKAKGWQTILRGGTN